MSNNPYDPAIKTVDQITFQIEQNKDGEKSTNTSMVDQFLEEVSKLKKKNEELFNKLQKSKEKVFVFKGKYEECLEIIVNNQYQAVSEFTEQDYSINPNINNKNETTDIAQQYYIKTSNTKGKSKNSINSSFQKRYAASFVHDDIKRTADRSNNSPSHASRGKVNFTSTNTPSNFNRYVNQVNQNIKMQEINNQSKIDIIEVGEGLLNGNDQVGNGQEELNLKMNNYAKKGVNLNIVMDKCLKTDENNKVLNNLNELARGICKSFDVGTTEICLVDSEVHDLIYETEKW